MVKHLSTMQDTRVPSLGWEDPLEKEMAIHSTTAAWKIPWTEYPGTLQSMGHKELHMTEQLHFIYKCNMDESQNVMLSKRKLDMKVYIMYDSIYVKS